MRLFHVLKVHHRQLRAPASVRFHFPMGSAPCAPACFWQAEPRMFSLDLIASSGYNKVAQRSACLFQVSLIVDIQEPVISHIILSCWHWPLGALGSLYFSEIEHICFLYIWTMHNGFKMALASYQKMKLRNMTFNFRLNSFWHGQVFLSLSLYLCHILSNLFLYATKEMTEMWREATLKPEGDWRGFNQLWMLVTMWNWACSMEIFFFF